MVELAIGDAYGAGFEYVDPNKVKLDNNLSGYTKHQLHNIKPGSYTDDTQMSLAIAETLTEKLPWTRETLAQKFIDVFRRDPRLGYSSGFYNFLIHQKNSKDFLEQIHSDSDRSGAAMRATPIGILENTSEVLEKTAIQASITHNTDSAIRSAQAASLLTHYFAYDIGPKNGVGQYLEENIKPVASIDVHAWNTPYVGMVKAQGWMSVRAAITAVMESTSMSELLQKSVAFTGDVDTVATIALAAGSFSHEIKQDIPEVLVNNLENGKYGRNYLEKLDQELKLLISK